MASTRGLPDLHDPVIISRSDTCSVRRPGDREHFAVVIAVRQGRHTCHALPDLDSSICIGSGNIIESWGVSNC